MKKKRNISQKKNIEQITTAESLFAAKQMDVRFAKTPHSEAIL